MAHKISAMRALWAMVLTVVRSLAARFGFRSGFAASGLGGVTFAWVLVAGAVVFTSVPVLAQGLPAVRFRSAALVMPDAAVTTLGTGTAHTSVVCGDLTLAVSGSCTGKARAEELRAVARGLGANRLDDAEFIKNAFEYVYKTIEITPLFGLQKGALGALLDHHGTAFDQAHLLVELLREDATVTATYKYGTVSLTGAQFKDWLGAGTAYGACVLLANGGIPGTVDGATDCSTKSITAAPGTVTMAHIWVSARGAGTSTYTLDPAYKSHIVTAGIADLGAAMGYNAGTFYNRATTGMVTVTNGIKRLNSDRIASQFDIYAEALAGYLKANHPNARAEDIIGGRKVDRDAFNGGNSTGVLAADTRSYGGGRVSSSWTDIPDQFRTVLRVQYGETDRRLYGDEIYGRPLWIVGASSSPPYSDGNPFNPELRLDTLVLGQALPPGRNGAGPASMTLSVDMPYAAGNGAYMDQSITKSELSSHVKRVNVVFGLGEAGKGQADYYRDRLLRAGLADSGFDNMLGYPLGRAVVAAEWLAQSRRAAEVLGRVGVALVQHHHSMGVVRSLGIHMDMESAVSVQSLTKDAARNASMKLNLAAVMAALEGLNAARVTGGTYSDSSTPAVFRRGSGAHRFYDVTSSSVWRAVIRKLSGYVSTARINDYVTAGYRVIVPKRSRSFNAFLGVSADGNDISHMVGESFGSKGGASSSDAAARGSPEMFDPALQGGTSSNFGSGLNIDPVRGGPTMTQTDLVTGSGPFPYSLPFTRTYASGDRLSRSVRPGGWKNNYLLRMGFLTAPLASMGEGPRVPALAATGAMVAAHVGLDVMDGGYTLPRILIAELIQHMFVETMYNAVVAADTFEGRQTFYRLSKFRPSSTSQYEYASQLGSAATWEFGTWTSSTSPARLITAQGVRYTYSYSLEGISVNPCYLTTEGGPNPLLGAVSSVEWPSGISLDFEYRSSRTWQTCHSPLEKVSNGLGRELRFSTLGGADNNELTVTDDTSRSVVVKPTQVVLPGNHVMRYTFEGPLTSVYLPGDPSSDFSASTSHTGKFLSLTYDTLGRVATLTDAEGRVTSYHVAGLTRSARTEVIDPLGNRTSLSFDENGRTARSVIYDVPVDDGTGTVTNKDLVTARSYDAVGRVSRVEGPDGAAVEYTYDNRHNLTAQTLKPKSDGLADLETGWTFPASCSNTNTCNKPISMTDARGAVTYYDYDTMGRPTSIREPCPANGSCAKTSSSRPVTSHSYATTGQPLIDTLAASAGRVTKTTDPTGMVTRYGYDGDGNLASVSVDPDGLNLLTRHYHDAVGNVCKTIGPRGSAGLNGGEANACTASLGVTARTYATTYTYDGNRRLTRITNALGRYTETVYNANGWVSHLEDYKADGTLRAKTLTTYRPDGQVWKNLNEECFSYPGGAQSTGNAGCEIVVHAYDGAGRLDTVTDGVGRVTKTRYDAAGQVVKVIGAFGTDLEQDTATYTYTAAGDRASVMDTNGNATTYGYDGYGRAVKTSYPSTTATFSTTAPNRPAGTDYESFERDANGNITWRRTRSGDWIHTTYDALNRETARQARAGSKTGAAGRRITTGYDKAGRVTSRARTNGAGPPTVAYAYDDAGRLERETATLGGRSYRVDYGYDAAGNLDAITWPGGETVTYAHDALHRVTSISEGTATYTAYEYDDLDRRTRATLGNTRVAAYGYKRDGALESLSHLNLVDSDDDGTGDRDAVWSYAYNAANQITQKALPRIFLWQAEGAASDSYTVNGLNQYTAVGTAAPTYDDNGNLTAIGPWAYTYDSENRLVSAVKTESGVSTTSTYDYDPEDRRISKTVAGVKTRYLWAGDDIIAEYNGRGVLLRRYIPGPGIDEPVAMLSYNAAGTKTGTQYYHADHAGTVVAMSGGSGDLAESYTYSPFGEVGSEGVEGNPFRYTGRQLDPETGLYYYRARYYSAALGRFLQTDPIGYGDSLNLYQYALNDPINLRDPSGTAIEPPEIYAGEIIVIGDLEEGICRSVGVNCFPGSEVNLGIYFNRVEQPIPEIRVAALGPALRGLGRLAAQGARWALVRNAVRVMNEILKQATKVERDPKGKYLIEMPGGAAAARQVLNRLKGWWSRPTTKRGYKGEGWDGPGGSFFGTRIGDRQSQSSLRRGSKATVDFNIPGFGKGKIKFK